MVDGTSQWYLIALHGDMVLRVRSGMPLGETAAGELSFDRSCAQLELDIADDGELMLSAVDDHELQFDCGTRCRQERLARNRHPEIRLPHNAFRLVTDFVDRSKALETVQIRPVQAAEDVAQPQTEAVPEPSVGDPTDAWAVVQPPPHRALRDSPGRAISRALALIPPLKQKLGALLVPLSARLRQFWLGGVTVNGRLGELRQTSARLMRGRTATVAAVIGLAGLAFALLLAVNPGQRDGGGPGPSTTVPTEPSPQRASAPVPVEGVAGQDADVLPRVVVSPPRQLAPPAVDVPRASAPQSRETGPAGSTQRQRESVAARAAQPVAPPREKPASAPKVAQTARIDNPVAEVIRTDADAVAVTPDKTSATIEPAAEERSATIEAPTEEQITTVEAPTEEQIATVEAPSEERSATVEATTEERNATPETPTVERARALFAADQALAQGRLTTPPESNAYTLYNRVLALDPESPEARTGLQSVRQGLVNRAMAQLASGKLEDARASLEAAANAGADPSLVGNLRAEVNYRQRVIDERTGQMSSQGGEPR